jgi:hypothetical protein
VPRGSSSPLTRPSRAGRAVARICLAGWVDTLAGRGLGGRAGHGTRVRSETGIRVVTGCAACRPPRAAACRCTDSGPGLRAVRRSL